MAITTLGISASPRSDSNSDLLLREALAGAKSAGAQTQYLRLSDYKVGPCIACNGCAATGKCVINDDYQKVLQYILDTDCLIFATPIYYMNVCAQAKMLIDRAQCLWAYKYLLGKSLFSSESIHSAMIIAVGGSKSIKQFGNVRSTMKAYFDSLQFRYAAGLFLNKTDNEGQILQQPQALQEAFRLGQLLAENSPDAANPVEVELT